MPRRDPRTPIAVGVGMVMQREEDARKAAEPLTLMEQAVWRAGQNCGAPRLLSDVQQIAVPRGRWAYANAAGAIARRFGAGNASTIVADVGVLQQSLIGNACLRIAEGEIDSALVVGGDTGYRLLRANITGVQVDERQQHDRPDITLSPHSALRHPVELRAGLRMPVGLYAILENAYRRKQGWALDEHRDRIARLYSRFSEIAAQNREAWLRRRLSPEEIRNASDGNPMLAFPYTRRHCSSWNVDQASALLLCSIEKARGLGIPEHRWIYARASTESNYMLSVCVRANLDACEGARITGHAALRGAGITVDELDWIDLYSCFPIAVQLFAAEIGLPNRSDLTITGGMSFAGGPYNNYQVHATCQMIDKLRVVGSATQDRQELDPREPRNGLVSCVSGVLTKQGFGIWSTAPGSSGFAFRDCTDEVAGWTPVRDVLEDYAGPAAVVGYTVLRDANGTARAIVLADAPRGRTLAQSEDPHLVSRFEEEDVIGKLVQIDGAGQFSMTSQPRLNTSC